MIGQGIDQRPVPVAVARVHDHAGGLVDDQQIVVFVGDVERDVLRHDLDLALGIGHHHGDAVQRLDLVARLGRTSAHEHAAAVDRRLDAVARAVLHPQREEFVEPHRLLPPGRRRPRSVRRARLPPPPRRRRPRPRAAATPRRRAQRSRAALRRTPRAAAPHRRILPAIGPSSKRNYPPRRSPSRRRAATPRHGGAPRPRPANRRVRPAGAPAPRSTPAPACPEAALSRATFSASSVRRSPTSEPTTVAYPCTGCWP